MHIHILNIFLSLIKRNSCDKFWQKEEFIPLRYGWKRDSENMNRVDCFCNKSFSSIFMKYSIEINSQCVILVIIYPHDKDDTRHDQIRVVHLYSWVIMNAATTYALISGRIKASLCDARYISRCRFIHIKCKNVFPNENRAVFIEHMLFERVFEFIGANQSRYQLMNHANRNFNCANSARRILLYDAWLMIRCHARSWQITLRANISRQHKRDDK